MSPTGEPQRNLRNPLTPSRYMCLPSQLVSHLPLLAPFEWLKFDLQSEPYCLTAALPPAKSMQLVSGFY